jgi:hypothetical protein
MLQRTCCFASGFPLRFFLMDLNMALSVTEIHVNVEPLPARVADRQSYETGLQRTGLLLTTGKVEEKEEYGYEQGLQGPQKMNDAKGPSDITI